MKKKTIKKKQPRIVNRAKLHNYKRRNSDNKSSRSQTCTVK